MELYHDPTSRSVRVRMALEELAVPYTLRPISLAGGEHRSAAHRRRHPLAQLPVLVDGDVVMIESAAICMYLAERFPDGGLAPALASPERAAYLQWCVFVPGTLEPAVLGAFLQSQGREPAPGTPRLDEALQAIAEPIACHGQLLAHGLSTPDVLVGPTLAVLARHGTALPAPLDAYLARLRARASFVTAHS